MRNLKKFLALVLAMMMVMGLMVTANAATDFTTKGGAEIEDDYESAVRILFAMGVLQGDNGVYDPLKPITRAEFATMLFRIHSGQIDDNNSKAFAQYANFTDVKSTDWFAGVVGYAQNEGLLEGDNTSGKYNPGATVTLTQVEVGLLRALGYGQKQEFSNSGWETAANRQAKISGMDKGLTSDDSKDMSAGANRQAVAQMFYNTLKLPTVELNANGTYSYVQVSDGGTSTKTLSLNELWFDMKEVEADDPALTKYNTDNEDPFGRPNVTKAAVVNGEVIPLERAEKVGEYVGNFTGANAKALTGQSTLTPSKVDVKYNGNLVTGWWQDAANNANGLWYDDTTGVPGYEIEIYENPADGKDWLVIVSEAYVAEVGEADADGNIAVTLHWDDGNNATSGASATVTVDKDHKYYDVISANQKGYIAAYLKNGTIIKAAELEKVEVEDISRLDKGTKKKASATITADGKPYGFNNTSILKKSDGTYGVRISTYLALDAATLYLYNDKILLIDQTSDTPAPAATAKNTMYVVAQWTVTENTAFGTKPTKMFQGVLPNGDTVIDEWTEATTGDIPTVVNLDGNTEKGYEYAVDDNGVYRFFESTGPAASNEGIFVGSGNINATDVKLGSNYFASDVKFIVVEGTVTVENGSTVKTTVKEGVQGVNLQSGKSSIVITKDANNNYVITTVFVRGDTITAAGGGTTTPEDLVYVASTAATGKAKDLKGDEVNEYTVYINGEATTVMMGTAPVATGWYKQTIASDTGRTTLDSTGITRTVTEKSATLVKIGDKYLVSADALTDGDATNATVVDVCGSGINSISALYAKKVTDGKAVTISAQYDANNVVTLIYVTAVAP